MEYNNLIEKLKEKNLLTTIDDKICVKPHSQYDFTTYPLGDDYILITAEEYIGLLMGIYMFDEGLTAIVDYEEQKIIGE